MTLDTLITRIESLEGPDRETDELIADALFERSHFAQLKDAPIGTGCMMWWQDGHQQSALRYTASLDAAVTLVPEDHYATFDIHFMDDEAVAKYRGYTFAPDWFLWQPHGREWLNRQGDENPLCATPALAICAAILRSRTHTEGERP